MAGFVYVVTSVIRVNPLSISVNPLLKSLRNHASSAVPLSFLLPR